MSVDVVLFLLRLISASLLLALLATLFVAMWRDFRIAMEQLQAARRHYGQLVALQEIDGSYFTIGESYPLLPLTSIGRAPTNDIVVKDDFASSEHARILLRNGQWWLEDRRSRNGTTLNEFPVNQPIVMTSGDIIGVGQKHFRLELEQ